MTDGMQYVMLSIMESQGSPTNKAPVVAPRLHEVLINSAVKSLEAPTEARHAAACDQGRTS
jgi:hypothetical protein